MGRRRTPPSSVAAFEPPFCPNQDCAHHVRAERDGDWPWEARGLRRIARAPYSVRQLRCTACGRWFRSSVFGPEYWKKVPGLGARVYDYDVTFQGVSPYLHSEVSPTRRLRITAGLRAVPWWWI